MPTIKIKKFGGLITNADAGDISPENASDDKNFDIDVHGKLKKRQGRKALADSPVSDDNFSGVTYWKNPKDSANPKWLIHGNQGAKKRAYSTSNWTEDTSVQFTSNHFGGFINMHDKVRMPNGHDYSASVLQYIDREFFFGAWQPTAALDHSAASLSYPSTWEYQTITEDATGTNSTGYYYYKFVPIFDGHQEAVLSSSYSRHELTNANKTLKIPIKFNTSDWNKRITAIKVYRSYSPTSTGDIEPVYYHIKTIPVNTESDHEDREVYNSSMHGGFVYDPDFDFSSYSDGTYWIYSVNNLYRISSVPTNHIAIVDKVHDNSSLGTYTGIEDDDKLWAETYEIYAGTSSAPPDIESTSATADGSNGYAGRDVVYNNSIQSSDAQYKDWVASIGSNNIVITDSQDDVLKLNANVSSYSNSISVYLQDNYYYGVSGSLITLNFYDYGLLDGSSHPLEGKTKIDVNYKYGVHMNGRMFAGNVKLADDDEVHEDWIIYSEFQQPDVLPIANYIQIQDSDGGSIKGLIQNGNNLVVFMDNGIFNLSVPSANPAQWSLIEAIEDVGCRSPHSIIKVGSTVFFGGDDDMYALGADFSLTPITGPIRDKYQAEMPHSESRFIYDKKRNRIICRFGNSTAKLYCYSLENSEWTVIDATGDTVDLLAVDSDNNVYTFRNQQSPNTVAVKTLEDATSTETVATLRKTGWMDISDLSDRGFIRRANISYKSGDAITMKIHGWSWDGSKWVESQIWPTTDDTSQSPEIPASTVASMKSLRVGRRTKKFMVELSTPASTNDVEINKLEFEVD